MTATAGQEAPSVDGLDSVLEALRTKSGVAVHHLGLAPWLYRPELMSVHIILASAVRWMVGGGLHILPSTYEPKAGCV